MKFKLLLTGLAALAIFMVAGCSSDAPLKSGDQPLQTAQFLGIPSDATITSATLWVHTPTLDTNLVHVYEVTAPWEEGTVTWNSFAGAADASVLASTILDDIGYFGFDLTAYAPALLDTFPDYGFLLRLDVEDLTPEFITGRESGVNIAYLEVCFETDDTSGCIEVNAAADAPIYGGMPDQNYGGMPLMTLGPLDVFSFEILFAFEVPVEEPVDYLSIGNYVWLDENMNGIQDSAEAGIAGVVVNLYGCSEDTLADPFMMTTMTDANGYYLFDSLMLQEYSLTFEAPIGYLFSPQDATDDSMDSDPDSMGFVACFEPLSATAYMAVDAGLYPEEVEPTDPGCTLGKGYWKNHTGFGPQEDVVSDLLPIWLGSMEVGGTQTAFDILQQHTYGAPTNGITKLAAHLLTTKLNIANGADDADIADIVDAADDFLNNYGWEDWDMLDKMDQKDVLHWKDMLESYNEGEIGPGSCDDYDDDYDDGEGDDGMDSVAPAGTLN